MPAQCAQCIEHARLHSGNWLGIGDQNKPATGAASTAADS